MVLRKRIRPSLSRSRVIPVLQSNSIGRAHSADQAKRKKKERKGKNKERLFHQRRCDVGSAFLDPFEEWTGVVHMPAREQARGRESVELTSGIKEARMTVCKEGEISNFIIYFPGMMMNRCVLLQLT